MDLLCQVARQWLIFSQIGTFQDLAANFRLSSEKRLRLPIQVPDGKNPCSTERCLHG